jgi:signal peptidase I
VKCSNPEFLELSKEILGHGLILRFQARGQSMFPAVRDGDILTVRPAAPYEIKQHDIIFFHTADSRVVAHRVTKKIQIEGRIILLTRGDFFRGLNEEVFFEDVLGKVSDIERNGCSFNICKGKGKLKDRFFFTLGPLIKTLRKALAIILFYVQSTKLYRSFIRRLMKAEVSYQNEQLDDSSERIFAKANNEVIGETTINKFKEEDDLYHGWWIFGTWVHWRYRRMGVGRQLTDIAFRVATQNGADDVKLLVFKDNKAAFELYKSLGFCQISIPPIDSELQKEAEKTGRLRIIMKKGLR